jgi:hypothetical protein
MAQVLEHLSNQLKALNSKLKGYQKQQQQKEVRKGKLQLRYICD